jgi:hypothetical protein
VQQHGEQQSPENGNMCGSLRMIMGAIDFSRDSFEILFNIQGTPEATQQHLSQNFAQRTHQDFTDFSYFRLTCVTETELKFYSIPAPDDMEPK